MSYCQTCRRDLSSNAEHAFHGYGFRAIYCERCCPGEVLGDYCVRCHPEPEETETPPPRPARDRATAQAFLASDDGIQPYLDYLSDHNATAEDIALLMVGEPIGEGWKMPIAVVAAWLEREGWREEAGLVQKVRFNEYRAPVSGWTGSIADTRTRWTVELPDLRPHV